MYVHVNDLKMYYEVHGTGYPLILLHGGSDNGMSTWEKCIPNFSKNFQVFVMDCRGHGKTNNPKGTLSYQLMCEDTKAFIHALKIKKPIICGWSDGGQIAFEIGIKYPTLAKCLLVGGALIEICDEYKNGLKMFGIDDSGRINLDHVRKTMPEFVKKMIEIHSAVDDPEYWKEFLKNLAKMYMDPSGFPKKRISEIITPTLILTGDRDQFLPVEETIKMFRLIPKAELTVVPNANHSLTLTHAEIFTMLSKDFIDRNSS